MKKLLVLALSAVLVLSLAAVSMAAVTLSGEVVAKYDFENAVDSAEGKIAFDGKVNDAVTAKIVYKYGGPGATLVADEYWFNVAGDIGALKVGYFGYGTSGKKDIIGGTYGDLKTEAALNYTYTADALTLKVWYAVDSNLVGIGDVLVADNAYAIGLAYDSETFGADVNFVDTQVVGDKTGYSVNAYIIPVEGLTAYIHAGKNQVKSEIGILGAVYTTGAVTLRGEIGLGDDNEDAWGVAAQYAAANGLTYKYTRENGVNDQIKTSEFKVTVAF